MVKPFRVALLLSSACLAATAAHAQTAAQPAGPSAGVAQLGEVVVTAQRRTERLHDVPIAVSVVSANQLAASNYTGLTDITNLVPSLQYNAYLGGGFEVRGVGTQSLNLTTDQDVAVVIDDVVQGLPQLTFAAPSYQALTDIDRVEVLKGPQGTLFGKNSSVGVLQIVTKKPQIGVYSADASISAASHGEYNFLGNVNLPISDTMAARLSAFEYHHDGFIKNEYNGEDLGGYDQYGVRGKLLWKPTTDLSVYLIGEYIRTQSPGNGAWTLRSCGSGFGAFSPCATDAAYGVHPGPNNRSVALDASTPANTETKSGSLHIDYNIGRDTLTLVSAYISMDSFENVDVDNSPRPLLDLDNSLIQSKQFSQEIRLSSPSNQFLEYTVGAYYIKTSSNYHNELAGTYGFLPDDSSILLSNGFAGTVSGGQTVLDTHNTSYAVFGQGTMHLTSKFQFIGGLRYTHDDVDASVHVNPVANICEFGFAFGGPCHSVALPSAPETESTSAHNVSGKITLKYDFTDRINAYVTAATGYKGPAIAYAALTPLSAAQPETSRAYEIGVKSQLFERRLTLNADLFYEKYKNFQADTFVLNAANPAASNFALANAGGLESKGVEADAVWAATDDLTFSASGAFNPTKFTDFVIQCQDQFTNPATLGGCYSVAGTQLFNAKGYPLPQSPRWSYTVGAHYNHDLSNDLVFNGDLNWSWKSSTYSVVADTNTIQGGYGLLNANLAIGAHDGSWQISLFARNLLNQQFVSAIFPTFLDNGGLTGLATPTIGYSNVPNLQSLRTIGMKLNVKFGG